MEGSGFDTTGTSCGDVDCSDESGQQLFGINFAGIELITQSAVTTSMSSGSIVSTSELSDNFSAPQSTHLGAGDENNHNLQLNYDRIIKQRSKRSYTPAEQKDDSYWQRRRKNNESAKLSRLKRRVFEINMEQQMENLVQENARLHQELRRLQSWFSVTRGGSLNSVGSSDIRNAGGIPECIISFDSLKSCPAAMSNTDFSSGDEELSKLSMSHNPTSSVSGSGSDAGSSVYPTSLLGRGDDCTGPSSTSSSTSADTWPQSQTEARLPRRHLPPKMRIKGQHSE